MRITIESTDAFAELDIDGTKVPGRVWVGETAGGVRVHAIVTAIGVLDGDDCAQFERELIPIPTVQ